MLLLYWRSWILSVDNLATLSNLSDLHWSHFLFVDDLNRGHFYRQNYWSTLDWYGAHCLWCHHYRFFSNILFLSFFDMDLAFFESSEIKWLKWLWGTVYIVMLLFDRSYRRWFLISTNLIWIFTSKWIRVKNKLRIIFWDLEIGLMKALLSYIIILMKASLFSKMYIMESFSENITYWMCSSFLF